MPPGRSSTLANSARAARQASSVGSTCRRISSSASVCRRQGDPAPQRALQAQRHLRRRGLGEGQALDAFRRRAGQHQPQQPVGQQLGLARPGRGGDERRNRRIRRRQLLAVGALARGGFTPPAPTSLIAVPRRRPFRHPGELLIVGEPRRQPRDAAATDRPAPAGRTRRSDRTAGPSHPAPRRQISPRRFLNSGMRLAGIEPAGQMPVDQSRRSSPRSSAPKPPSAAIAASSSNCGARPSSTSFWRRRGAGLVVQDRQRAVVIALDPVRPAGQAEPAAGTHAVRSRPAPRSRSRPAPGPSRRSVSSCATQSAMRSSRGDHQAISA